MYIKNNYVTLLVTFSSLRQLLGLPYHEGRVQLRHTIASSRELHFAGLNGMASHSDTQDIRIIGFFFENRLHWQS